MSSRLGIQSLRGQLLALLTAGPLLVIPISLLELSRDDSVRTQAWPNGTTYRLVEATVIESTDRKGAERLFEDYFGVRPDVQDGGMRLSALSRVRHGGKQDGPTLRQTTRWFLDMRTTYELIDESSVYPATPHITDGTVRWVLTAADLHSESGAAEPLTIRATSQQFKCGNATVMLYVALWVAGWLAITVYRRLRARPKRI